MSAGMRRTTWLTGLLLVAPMSACGPPGDVSITNDGGAAVTVKTGHEKTTVLPGGAVVLLDVGCVTGAIEVRYASGRTVALSGPVCPDQAIEINDTTASIVPADREAG